MHNIYWTEEDLAREITPQLVAALAHDAVIDLLDLDPDRIATPDHIFEYTLELVEEYLWRHSTDQTLPKYLKVAEKEALRTIGKHWGHQ